MYIFSEIERLNKINYLITHRATGTPDEFAEKVNLSRRQLFNHLEYLRCIGAKIKYDRYNETYYFCDGFEFEIRLYVNGRRREYL